MKGEPMDTDLVVCGECEASVAGVDGRDVEELRAALRRENLERRRAQAMANIQTNVVKYAVDLLVREPDIEAFFRALMNTLAEEGESHKVSVWLIDEDQKGCDVWMAQLDGQVFSPSSPDWKTKITEFPRQTFANHLFSFQPGWHQTIDYSIDDERMPASLRDFFRHEGLSVTLVAPLLVSDKNLGWITLCTREANDCGEGQWWRIALIEAIARQAALALHHSRVVEQKRVEERRKAILEERNRLARDIHDNLAQGFAAILMQLQGAQREACTLPPSVARSIETAVDLARTHLTEARRSVGTLRPNVGTAEDVGRAIKRLADLGQRTTGVPIDVQLDELPRFGDGVEREIISIVQEALSNAVRHARARRITIKASTVNSLGLRLSVADDGRGIPRERPTSGFGLTSMQERADRIGASLTIVTAPRSGTEVVLAWEPSSLPTQVYAIN
ncbi:MAG TPA: GAF domain-containing sensor histidine kinase [Vicinamibacterales bacterium]|jgi:signal transduction histidine kinase